MSMKSNASIFEDRGNPWATAKDFERTETVFEPLTDYERRLRLVSNGVAHKLRRLGVDVPPPMPLQRPVGRLVDRGDPQFDQFAKAALAARHRELPSEFKPKTEMTERRRIAVAMAEMNAVLARKKLIKVKPSPAKPQAPVVGKLAKSVTGFTMWYRTADGEEEREYKLRRIADVAFRHRIRNTETTEVELWSNSTGELLLRWKRKE